MTSTSRRFPRHSLAAAAIALALLAGAPATQARSRGDHERAHDAVQAGEAMPLAQVMQRLNRDHPGQVLEIELERADGLWIYEVKLLQSDGQLLKLDLDARTGKELPNRRRPSHH